MTVVMDVTAKPEKKVHHACIGNLPKMPSHPSSVTTVNSNGGGSVHELRRRNAFAHHDEVLAAMDGIQVKQVTILGQIVDLPDRWQQAA